MFSGPGDVSLGEEVLETTDLSLSVESSQPVVPILLVCKRGVVALLHAYTRGIWGVICSGSHFSSQNISGGSLASSGRSVDLDRQVGIVGTGRAE